MADAKTAAAATATTVPAALSLELERAIQQRVDAAVKAAVEAAVETALAKRAERDVKLRIAGAIDREANEVQAVHDALDSLKGWTVTAPAAASQGTAVVDEVLERVLLDVFDRSGHGELAKFAHRRDVVPPMPGYNVAVVYEFPGHRPIVLHLIQGFTCITDFTGGWRTANERPWRVEGLTEWYTLPDALRAAEL